MNYEQALDLTVRLGDCLPPEHLARFVVDSVALLDLSALYAHYGSRGGEPYAPEVLLGLLFYGYATGVFSSRKIERATYEAVPFRFIAGNQHPDPLSLTLFRRKETRKETRSSFQEEEKRSTWRTICYGCIQSIMGTLAGTSQAVL